MRILLAGIGNIFVGDDGFGVAVAQALAGRKLPEGVRVVDYGIRSFDLVYALLDGYDVTVLIDAVSLGEAPGTIYTIEAALPEQDDEAVDMGGHNITPERVLRMAKAMGWEGGRVLLVGCEPETLGPEEGQLGLSATVEAAVGRAVTVIEELVAEELLEKETV